MVVIASLGLLTAPVGPLKGMAAQDQQCRLLLPLVEVPLNLKLKAFGLSLVFLFLFLLQMTVTVQAFFLLFSLSSCCSQPWLLRMFGFVLKLPLTSITALPNILKTASNQLISPTD